MEGILGGGKSCIFIFFMKNKKVVKYYTKHKMHIFFGNLGNQKIGDCTVTKNTERQSEIKTVMQPDDISVTAKKRNKNNKKCGNGLEKKKGDFPVSGNNNVKIRNESNMLTNQKSTSGRNTTKKQQKKNLNGNVQYLQNMTINHCDSCNYSSDKKWVFQRHLQSKKHLKKIGLMCKICEKRYETKSGLWKHNKKPCEKINKKRKQTETVVANDIGALSTVLLQIVKNQEKVQEMNTEMIQKIIPKIGNNNTVTTNNTINNKISIKLFLDEYCKNAINLKDFIENIQLSLADLQGACIKGGAEVISDVLVQKLTDMKPTERPIHCSDARRSHFYIKDKGEWARDNNTRKLDGAISRMVSKQINTLYHWQQDNPNWMNSKKLSNQWEEMTQQITWTAEEARKYKRKIKRSLMKPTDLKEAMQETIIDEK